MRRIVLYETFERLWHWIQAVLIIGEANPVFSAPADWKFGDALQKVAWRAHSGLFHDETDKFFVVDNEGAHVFHGHEVTLKQDEVKRMAGRRRIRRAPERPDRIYCPLRERIPPRPGRHVCP